ncbi:pectate lyase family protein [Cellvibrio polysaccharolyticus]|uniref:Pectate lyase n=1 Tax=Cellvibrio polysaccharolyticus TaxID=2082724 RepID=A0A928V0R8_9GAMM|nr:pectate lyase [Cellvibrio polysaccharolyticus]MBE8715653.1 pectate lyase [Cellvibrio polysaccharolyticus]
MREIFFKPALLAGVVLSSIFVLPVYAQSNGPNLALTGPGAGADGSGFSNTKLVRDGDAGTYTQSNGGNSQRVSVKWSSAISFNRVVLRESGNAITSWQLINNDTGALVASGNGIGSALTVDVGDVSMKKLNLVASGSAPLRMAEIEVYQSSGNASSASSSSSSSSSVSSVISSSSSSLSSSSSSSSSSTTSSSSSSATGPIGNISQECINLATNPYVNWRETALQSDQDIVKCLSDTLGRPIGYGENARGGFDPDGNSQLTIIVKNHPQGKTVEEQVRDAVTGEDHNWIVFDKVDFAASHEVGLYRLHCSNPALQTLLGATEAQCVNYRQWCAPKGFNDHAVCMNEFFNKALNSKALQDVAELRSVRNLVVGSNKTLDGRMSEAYFRFSGFAIGRDSTGSPTQTANNIIFTHLNFQGAGHTEDHYWDPDMIRSTGASHDIWIHKNTFYLTGDSAFDVKVGAYDITMSFNKIIDVKRAALHSSSDSHVIDAQIATTMHHNAFVTRDENYSEFGNTARRVPLIRRGTSHMFNNLFVNYRKDIVSVRRDAQLLWEDNALVVNRIHQEKASLEASLSELQKNLVRDVSGGNYRGEGIYLWFSDAACNLQSETQTHLTASSGSVGNLTAGYSAYSQNVIGDIRLPAGQDLVDYVSATAGKYGEIPFSSPLAADIYSVLGLPQSGCQ